MENEYTRLRMHHALVRQEIERAHRGGRLFISGVVLGMVMGILLMLITS